ncbi:MAG: hypothetical protein OXU86_05940 [Thaumarchaeota archaeon]|nr:hypothetical protein [Nitrososphaerota archaeon]
MKHTHQKAAIAGGLAVACLAAVAVGAFAVLGATAGSQGWAMYVDPELPVEGAGAVDIEYAAMDAELDAALDAIEAERNAFLEGIGVVPPGLTAEEAAEIRERAAPVLARYATLHADAATGDAAWDSINAEYDALLAELGAAPPALTAEQARAIDEYRNAEAERLDRVYSSHGLPEMPELSEEDAAALVSIDEEAEAIAERFGIVDPELTVEQGFALDARLAPLEQRYEELHAEIEALYEQLESIDNQYTAIVVASGVPDGSQLTDEQWEEYMAAMRPLEVRAEEIYERIYSSVLPQ